MDSGIFRSPSNGPPGACLSNPDLPASGHGNASFQFQTPGQRPGGRKAISYQITNKEYPISKGNSQKSGVRIKLKTCDFQSSKILHWFSAGTDITEVWNRFQYILVDFDNKAKTQLY